MSAQDTRTEAAATAASADSKEKDVKIPVEAAEEAEAPEMPSEQVEHEEETPEQAAREQELSEEEMVEAAIRAGEEAAQNDFKLKYEQVTAELAEVRRQLSEAEDAQSAADAKVKEAQDRATRVQADWENFRRRTASERLAEKERATEKLVTALLPVIDDMERAIDHARTQEMDEAFSQFVDGVEAVHAKMLDVFAHEGVEPIDPKGEAFDPLEHQAVGRVEDAGSYEETVHDVYQKGYRMADRVLRAAMVTVTYGGEKRPEPEPEADSEEAPAEAPAEDTQE
ncbi:nucleotide exchange factor GrpE [Enorma phocaeensis]|uniref:nucleotide exchange factor GrpE n=1 Tax=Enorma phocaeensis TaxID=1871019 RepID=UPI000C85B4D3|nr:nucleotide exchange factor GrpE [Enorma phocaeensis]